MVHPAYLLPTHRPRCPRRMVLERLSWRVICPNCQESFLVDPQGSRSHSAPSRGSCASSRRYGEVSALHQMTNHSPCVHPSMTREFQRFNGLRVEQTHGELFGCNIIILNMIVCSRFVVVVLLLLFHLEKDRRPLSCLCHCFVLRSFCVVDRRLKS